jgi:hypothetical protein
LSEQRQLSAASSYLSPPIPFTSNRNQSSRRSGGTPRVPWCLRRGWTCSCEGRAGWSRPVASHRHTAPRSRRRPGSGRPRPRSPRRWSPARKDGRQARDRRVGKRVGSQDSTRVAPMSSAILDDVDLGAEATGIPDGQVVRVVPADGKRVDRPGGWAVGGGVRFRPRPGGAGAAAPVDPPDGRCRVGDGRVGRRERHLSWRPGGCEHTRPRSSLVGAAENVRSGRAEQLVGVAGADGEMLDRRGRGAKTVQDGRPGDRPRRSSAAGCRSTASHTRCRRHWGRR